MYVYNNYFNRLVWFIWPWYKKKRESISMRNNLTNVDIKLKFLFSYTLALLSIAIL